MEFTTTDGGNEMTATTTAADFSYDVDNNAAAEAFFSLMARSNVQHARIDAMRETRKQFIASQQAAK